MAIPLSKIGWFFKGKQQDTTFNQNHITTFCGEGNLAFPSLARRKGMPRMLKTSKATSETNLTPKVSEVEDKTRIKYNEQETMVAEENTRKLADTWKEIHGRHDWAGMLDPIEPLMRSELLRYGDMAQACYDAFDQDPYSKYCGSCKIKPSMFFEDLGLTKYGYEVTTYLYSAYNLNLPSFFIKSLWPDRWSTAANWSGYVAVSNDETSAYLGRRDITIAWRGTVVKHEWIADLMDFLKPVTHHKIASRDPTIRVEAGFLHLYTDKDKSCQFSMYSAREQILAELKRLIQKYAKEELSITITGHSLGSALVILNAYDIAETGVDLMNDGRIIPISVFSFSGPRVGNARFKERLEGLGVKVLRVVNIHDKVPTVPGILFNEHVPMVLQKIGQMSPWCYSHVGEELDLDHKKSPFLKETNDLACFHNLEAHLHLLDG